MKRKLVYILLVLSICLLIFSIVTTYSRYSTALDKNTNINLTKWKIFINDADISSNSDISAYLTPVFTENDHIQTGKIVPTSSGYFDIEIDSSNTDLPFLYTITIDDSNNEIDDFIISGYSVNDNPEIINFTGSISSEVLPASNIDLTKFRFFIEWIDGSNNVTNNTQDSNLSINEASAIYNVTISIEQKSE